MINWPIRPVNPLWQVNHVPTVVKAADILVFHRPVKRTKRGTAYLKVASIYFRPCKMNGSIKSSSSRQRRVQGPFPSNKEQLTKPLAWSIQKVNSSGGFKLLDVAIDSEGIKGRADRNIKYPPSFKLTK
jgi:hypothetical protein